MTRPINVDPSTSTAAFTNASSSRARVAELGQHHDLLDHVEHDGERELVLVAPAPVDRRLRDARAGRRLLDREAADAALDEQLARRLQDGELALGAARAPAAACGRRGVLRCLADLWLRRHVLFISDT